MVKKRYDVDQRPVPSVSQQVESNVDQFDNPTFSKDDTDRPEAEVSAVGHVDAPVLSPRDKEKSRFRPMPIESGDRIKLAFLIGFPLTMFLVGVIVTSQYV